MNDVSLLVGLKNNIEYTKLFYNTTRKLYPDIEICFVSYGSTDGTHNWLDSLKDDCVKFYYSIENKTLSDTYNKAAEISSGDYVVFCHNDLILGPNFIENIKKHINNNTVVSYTTIEPPITPDHLWPGKLVANFGLDKDTLKIKDLYQYIKEKQLEFKDKISTELTSFFLCINKNVYFNMGGLDNLFNPMYCEDIDLSLRFRVMKMNLVTSLDSMCYHFVSKTTRGSNEFSKTHSVIETKSIKNFIRKWGCNIRQWNMPIPKRYDIGFIVKNCDQNLLGLLEPWSTNIYVDFDYKYYIQEEQKFTKFNLSKKIKSINSQNTNDILVEFDAKFLTSQNFLILQQLSDIIENSGEVGDFELDIFKIKIVKIECKDLSKNSEVYKLYETI